MEKKIPKEKIFDIIEEAMMIAARRHAGQDSDVAVHIDRTTGEISVFRDNVPLTTSEITERIGAQTARQIIMQKIRDAEKDRIYDEFSGQIGELVSGRFYRQDKGLVFISLRDNVEAFLPRSEQVPGENFQRDEHVSAQIVEVNKNGNNAKVRVVLSRSRPSFLRKLLEREIPEINEGIIEIKELSRDPGHRAKVAVASRDPHLDLVGTCVGTRGSRIRAVREALGGNEQIDIIPWLSEPADFIKSALQPAEILEVIPCPLLGRAIVLVDKEERSKAIGRKGQNVRLATRLCGWDIEIMTQEDLQDVLDSAVEQFKSIAGMTDDLTEAIVGAGFTSYDDLSIIEPAHLIEIGKITEEQAEAIIGEAERRAELGTAVRAAEEAARAANDAVQAADDVARAITGDDPNAATQLARKAREYAARARNCAEEAAKSAELVDIEDIVRAAEEAKHSANFAEQAAEHAGVLVVNLRSSDNHRSQNISDPPRA